jgi:hypothetical protein
MEGVVNGGNGDNQPGQDGQNLVGENTTSGVGFAPHEWIDY